MAAHQLDTLAALVGAIYLDTVVHMARASSLATARFSDRHTPAHLVDQLLGEPARWCPESLRLDIPCRLETVAPRGDRRTAAGPEASAYPQHPHLRRRAIRTVVAPSQGPICHHLSLIADSCGRVEKRLDGRLFGVLDLEAAYARSSRARSVPRTRLFLLSPDDARALAQIP